MVELPEVSPEKLRESFHGQVDALADEIVATMNGAKPGRLLADTAILDTVEQARDMIPYPEFAARGWPIGSGPTESRCKTSTSRLKVRGRRRNGPHAEAVAALTTLKDSGQWNRYRPTPYQTATYTMSGGNRDISKRLSVRQSGALSGRRGTQFSRMVGVLAAWPDLL